MLGEFISKRFNYKLWSTIFVYIGFFLILSAFCTLLIVYFITGQIYFYNISSLSIVVSFGIGVFTIGIAFGSEAKMIENANVNFLQAASDFEKARMKYLNPLNPYKLEAFLWRSKNHLERAYEFDKKIIKIKHQEKLYGYFYVSLWQLFDQGVPRLDLPNNRWIIEKPTWVNMEQKNRNRVIEMYGMIREYKRKSGDENKLMGLFEQYMGKFEIESENNFYRRLVDC